MAAAARRQRQSNPATLTLQRGRKRLKKKGEITNKLIFKKAFHTDSRLNETPLPLEQYIFRYRLCNALETNTKD